MTKRKQKHRGLRTSWWIVRLVRWVADRMDELHAYLLRAMFDNCADCGMEDGYGHRNGCQFGRRFTVHKGRVTKVSMRPPLVLPDDDRPTRAGGVMSDKLSKRMHTVANSWREVVDEGNAPAELLAAASRMDIEAEDVAALEARLSKMEPQLIQAMDALGMTWGDLEGFGSACEGIADAMERNIKRLSKMEEALAEYENDDVRVRRERSFRARQLMQIKLIGMDAAGLPDATALTVFHQMGLAIDEAIGA